MFYPTLLLNDFIYDSDKPPPRVLRTGNELQAFWARPRNDHIDYILVAGDPHRTREKRFRIFLCCFIMGVATELGINELISQILNLTMRTRAIETFYKTLMT
jgi:hypothetical protein